MDPIVSLQGRTIVVTGAGQGIGKGIVELAIELGANVVAVDLNGQTLDAAVSRCRRRACLQCKAAWPTRLWPIVRLPKRLPSSALCTAS